jgi:hypothetical protein
LIRNQYLISILLGVILLSIPFISCSQSVTEVLKYLQDDLPEIEKYPNGIYQDSRGFLWWGGNYKIQQYDGYTLRSYYIHEIFKSEESISGYPTVDFLEDSEKDFLVLFDHALMFYDTIYKELTRFDFEYTAKDSLIHIDYSCLYEDDQHFICIGTSYGSILRIPVKTLKKYLDHSNKNLHNNILIRKPEFSIIKVDDFDRKDDGKYLYMDILQDKFSNYWVPTKGAVYQISRQSSNEFISVPYFLNAYKNQSPPAGTNGPMFLDDHENIWIGRSNSLFMVDYANKENLQFREFRFDHFTWWVNYVKGELWMSPSKSIYGYKLIT